jgi:hypothetical protein
MPRSIARILVVPVVSASALASVLAGVAVAAPAHGTHARGELTHTLPLAGLTHLKDDGITVTAGRQAPSIISAAFVPAGSMPGGQAPD